MATDGKLPAQKSSDLRRHARFPIVDATVRLTKNGFFSSIGSNKARGGVNLSEGGIMIRTGERLAQDTQVRITIDLEAFGEHVTSVGVVRWCGESARGKKDFFVGIQFKDMAPEDVKKIARMRTWFTSPEYRMKRTGTRRSQQG